MIRVVLFSGLALFSASSFKEAWGLGEPLGAMFPSQGRGNALWKPLTLGNHMRIIATRETLFDFL